MRAFVLYLLVGSMLLVSLYATSRVSLPRRREILAHALIALVWPLFIANVVRHYNHRKARS